MKVNIEVQILCIPRKKIRGVAYYTLKLARTLKARSKNQYTLSYFDFNDERNNKSFIKDYFGDIYDEPALLRCTSLSYKEIMDYSKRDNYQELKTYEEYLRRPSDIYHFPHSAYIPPQVGSNKNVVTIHDILPLLPGYEVQFGKKFCSRYRQSIEDIIKNHYTVICDSANTKKDLLERFDLKGNDIYVVYPGYDSDILYPEYDDALLRSFGIDQPYILYLGAIDIRKGVNDLVMAYENIKNQYDDVILVLSGMVNDSQRSEMKALLDEWINNNRIIMTGFVSETQKRVLMSCAELFVFPSEYEGYGLPILEAMACGTPVITTDVSSIPEVGGDAVEYVSPHNIEQLEEKIRQLLDDRDKRKNMSEKGLKRCRGFTWDNTAGQTEDVYSKMMK